LSASEAWEFRWGTAAGDGGLVRLALHGDERVAWFWAYLWRPGLGPVVVRDHEVALPRGKALEIRADSLWSSLVCETPGEHWSIGLEAFAVALDSPEDALVGEIGERIAFGLDLEWETLGDEGVNGQPGRVRGDVLLGRETLAVDTPGPFVHSAVDDGFGARTIVAWDDGAWSWGADAGMAVEVRSRALVPVDGGVVVRDLGGATLGERRGTAWIEANTAARERIG
jgi:hypothetical protein